MSIYALKPRFQSLLRPLTAMLARSGVTANQVTLAAGIVSIALGVFVALNAPAPFPWLALVIFLAVLTEFAGILGPTVGASRRYDGPMGKSDRAFVFGALGMWAGLALPMPAWIEWLMPVLAGALVLTIVNRVRNGLGELQGVSSRE